MQPGMTPADAARILELSEQATPEQVEARFLELRRKLEDKIAKAPTPGLQAKYRESLAELTTAFETLALAADSSALPVLKREQGEGRKEQGGTSETGGPASLRAGHGAAATPPRAGESGNRKTRIENRKSGGREFVVVALIAVVVLAGGGWWVVKTRAEKAEKARIAAEAKAAADQAAEQKRLAAEAEKARLEQAKVQLRTVLAEAKIAWEVAEREERDAERRLSELRSELRSLRDADAARRAELEARAESAQRYSYWLRDYLLRHPLKLARARLEEMLQASALAEAESAGAEVARLVQTLQRDLAMSPGGEASLSIETNLPTVAWEITGPGGTSRRGVGTTRVTGLLFGDSTVTFSHPTFEESIVRSVPLVPGQDTKAEAAVEFYRYTINGLRPGDRVEVNGQNIRPLPDGTYPCQKRRPGGLVWHVYREGHLLWESWHSGREDDVEEDYVAVPLQPRPLLDAALKAIADYPPQERTPLLTDVLWAASINRLLAPEERARIIKEAIRAIDEEPMPEAADAAAGEPARRLQARLPLVAELLWTEPAAAPAMVEQSVAALRRLTDEEKLMVPMPVWIMASQRDAMLDFTRLLQPAFESQPDWARDSMLFIGATQLYGLLSLHGREAEAEAWKARVQALRDPAKKEQDERAFGLAKTSLAAYGEVVRLRAALKLGNFDEFNRLVRARTGDETVSTQTVSSQTVYDLLALGFEKEAVDLAVSVNGSGYHYAIFHYATYTGRLAVLEDYQSRVRHKNRLQELGLAEAYSLQGNATKANVWLEKAGQTPDSKVARVFTLAQLGDLSTARAEFDQLEKDGLKLSSSDRGLRLPQLVAAARLLRDPAREQRMIDLSGERNFQLDVGWLARMGDLGGAVSRATSARLPENILNEFYRYASLRARSPADLPWIGDGENKVALITTMLARLNPPRRPAASIEMPYPRQTPATFRETMFVPYPNSMRRSGLAGEARIVINIDATGRATGYTTVTAPHPDFAEAMFKVAAEKGFHPALENGRPVEGTYEMTRNFRL
jgi:hypothetical protein